MANTAVSGTLFCSDGTEIPLFVAAIAEGTESNLTTNTTNNFTGGRILPNYGRWRW